MDKDKTPLEQKATNKDLESQALVQGKIQKGIFLFKAQELIFENEDLFLKKDYNRIFRNIQRIANIVTYEERATQVDEAEYKLEWLLILLTVLKEQNKPEHAQKHQQALDEIGALLEKKDYKEAVFREDKRIALGLGLPKEIQMGWCRSTAVDLNLKMDELMNILKDDPERFIAFKQNPLDPLRNYLEEVLTYISYEDLRPVKEPVLKSYSMIWQVRRFLEKYGKKELPIKFRERKAAILEGITNFAGELQPLTGSASLEPFQPVIVMMERIEEDFCGGYMSNSQAQEEYDKAQELAMKKQATRIEETALSVVSDVQHRIDETKAHELDVALPLTIFSDMIDAFGKKDFKKASQLLQEVNASLDSLHRKNDKDTALTVLGPAEKMVEDIEQMGCDASEARAILHKALDAIEKGEYGPVARYAVETKQKVAQIRACHLSKDIEGVLGPLQQEMAVLAKGGKDISKATQLVREARMMLETNKIEKAKEYGAKAKEEVERLKAPKPEKKPVEKTALKPLPSSPAPPKQKPPLTPEQKQMLEAFKADIEDQRSKIDLIRQHGGQVESLEKLAARTKEALEERDFEKAKMYVEKFAQMRKTLAVEGAYRLIEQISKTGIETDYLRFIVEHCAFAYENNDAATGDEYMGNFYTTVADLTKPKDDQTQAGPGPGAEEARFCTACGAKTNADSAFCPKCGKKL